MLDIEAVQAFVLTADLKSFTRAAEALDTTQSAVSLKIKRLEDRLGRRLLERTPRLVRLSPDGNAFLEPARGLIAAHQGAVGSFAVKRQRRLSVGISHHIVGPELPVLLRQMARMEPAITLEIHVASSREILDALEAGAVDAPSSCVTTTAAATARRFSKKPSAGWPRRTSSTAPANRCAWPPRPSPAACGRWR